MRTYKTFNVTEKLLDISDLTPLSAAQFFTTPTESLGDWKAVYSDHDLSSRVNANIICFSVLSRAEFERIRSISGIWHENKLDHPTFLVGFDIESRSDPAHVHQLYSSPNGKGPVLPEEGEAFALQIGALKYTECSLRDEHQIRAIFNEVRSCSR